MNSGWEAVAFTFSFAGFFFAIELIEENRPGRYFQNSSEIISSGGLVCFIKAYVYIA